MNLHLLDMNFHLSDIFYLFTGKGDEIYERL